MGSLGRVLQHPETWDARLLALSPTFKTISALLMRNIFREQIAATATNMSDFDKVSFDHENR
jgi:hypothetical protein